MVLRYLGSLRVAGFTESFSVFYDRWGPFQGLWESFLLFSLNLFQGRWNRTYFYLSDSVFKGRWRSLHAFQAWWADHCNENKDFYCFSQSKSFACVKEYRKNLKNNSGNNSVRNLIRGNFPKNLFCFRLLFEKRQRARQWFKLQAIKRRIDSCKLFPCVSSRFYTLINWVGGKCRNIFPAAFSVLTDRREVKAEKAKDNIFLHWLTNSVSKSFIALLTNPNNFIEKIDPTQQNSPAESLNLHVNSLPLCWSMEIKFCLSWVIKLKYSIEIDVCSSQTTVNEILNELFYPFRPQQN